MAHVAFSALIPFAINWIATEFLAQIYFINLDVFSLAFESLATKDLTSEYVNGFGLFLIDFRSRDVHKREVKTASFA